MTIDSTTTETETVDFRSYVWLPDWSAGATDSVKLGPDEQSEACERAEAWLTEHEGDDISISVRMPRGGEAPGLYERRTDGSLQILGYTIAAPDEVSDLTARAWQHALETWPQGVRCECGEVEGVRCDWCGAVAETVLVETMPEHLRASHVAAGNRGVWPHNGARRIRVSRECGARLVRDDAEWASIVG